ncbi:hypothetical protein [Sphingobacterium rhinopitheci]|uniref:hypothetical protein n=1 Tax=Sphingobacterium rhinopitheci TaxID=2781960 RepID=UPI001F51A831|nr:hypothetical protein [Sphingobacterium rhinopitheci]MCI0921160.1 hypothetical protein [Sphingobacterium rhinopitheci]
MSLVLCLFSCKENVINGFNAKSVQEDLALALNGSEWVADSPNAYYEKITFYKEVLRVTHKGVTTGVKYDVTNVSGLMESIPDQIQLRLKSGLPTDELYLKNDYSTLSSVIRSDVNTAIWSKYEYKRVK